MVDKPLTLRFEHDRRSPNSPDIVWTVAAESFRVLDHDGLKQVAIPNDHGVDIYHPLMGDDNSYDRLYVMNASGATVARFVAATPRTEEEKAAAEEKIAELYRNPEPPLVETA